MALIFTPPGPNEPGYLRRLRLVADYNHRLRKDLTGELVQEVAEFLVQFVTEPADREQALEMLWDASRDQFVDMLGSVAGGGEDPLAGRSK